MAEIIAAEDAMEAALALLEAGEVVAIPTETVYGLAGDATNGIGVARIFEALVRLRDGERCTVPGCRSAQLQVRP